MSDGRYRIVSSVAATATALFLNLPPIGSGEVGSLTPKNFHAYAPLADAGQAVADAFSTRAYAHAQPDTLFSLMTDVALRLIKESKPLEADFAGVVQKEFWNLI